MTSNLSVKHAVINIIENAIKAAHSKVNVSFHVTTDTPSLFEIAIKDDGPGIPSEVMEKLGDPFISSRKESMGLGIFLANAAIERLHGSIEMVNMKGRWSTQHHPPSPNHSIDVNKVTTLAKKRTNNG